jgi:hypothetical protein
VMWSVAGTVDEVNGDADAKVGDHVAVVLRSGMSFCLSVCLICLCICVCMRFIHVHMLVYVVVCMCAGFDIFYVHFVERCFQVMYVCMCVCMHVLISSN